VIKWLTISICILAVALVPSLLAASNTVLQPENIIPVLHPGLTQKLQPFTGAAAFKSPLELNKPCTLQVTLTSLVSLDSAQSFRLARLHPYSFEVSPETLVWEAPIDSGDSFSSVYTFTPTEVGTYQFTLGRRLGTGWQSLGKLAMGIDEDGDFLYAGAESDYHLTLVPPHPRREKDSVVLVFPLNAETSDPRFERHFTAKFTMHPAPALKETTFVDFTIECHYDLYREVQFILQHSTNLKPSDLPESWGDRAGLAKGYRFYHGSFSFVPLTWGISYLDFQVVGIRPMVKNVDRLTTEFPIYFVLSEDGDLKYIGYDDPWERYTNPDDPMLGSLKGLLEINRRDFRIRNVRSLPDYMGDEQKAVVDSIKSSNESFVPKDSN
jgi:hypothetical protein